MLGHTASIWIYGGRDRTVRLRPRISRNVRYRAEQADVLQVLGGVGLSPAIGQPRYRPTQALLVGPGVSLTPTVGQPHFRSPATLEVAGGVRLTPSVGQPAYRKQQRMIVGAGVGLTPSIGAPAFIHGLLQEAPFTIPNLTFFFDSRQHVFANSDGTGLVSTEGSGIASWRDRSLSAHLVVAPQGSAMPSWHANQFGAAPGLRFGTGKGLTKAFAPFYMAPAATLIAVFKTTTNQTNAYPVATLKNTSPGDNSFDINLGSNTIYSWLNTGGNAASTTAASAPGAYDDGIAKYIMATVNLPATSNEHKLYRNGALVHQYSTAGTEIWANAAAFGIGALNPVTLPTLCFAGDLCAVLGYSSEITGQAKADLDGYVQEHFGVVLA